MIRKLVLSIVLVAMPAAAADAVSVTAPRGSAEAFSRADLVDVVEILRLTGADVAFAAAAGSYTATLGQHAVQFTPGGSLAVMDSRLVALPGPVRVLEGHVVTTVPVLSALLSPLGFTVRGDTATRLELVASGGSAALTVSLMRDEAGTVVAVSGSDQVPRVRTVPGGVTLLYAAPVQLAEPVPQEGALTGGTVEDRALTLSLAPGTEVVSTYALKSPPRFVMRIAVPEPVAAAPERRQGYLVVLDPGHGGEDQGAEGAGGALEKDVTLAVARLTMQRLQQTGIEARLTRDGDESVSLRDRTALANRLRADAFVSIHANASPARGARGAETYFMSADASDPQAEEAAQRENAGAATDPTLGLILWDLAHVANLNASSRLAREIQERLNVVHGIKDRGVKQAPFVVLTGATMPAALVEIGFLSNPEEAQRVTEADTQARLADALAAAVVGFLTTSPQPTAPPLP